MGIIGASGQFLLSLVAGDMFSGTIALTDNIKKALENKSQDSLLKDYHKWFINTYDSEISLSNDDMFIMEEKREELLKAFNKYLQDENIDINAKRKDLFFREAYKIVCINRQKSEVVERYIDGFYQIVLAKQKATIPSEVLTLINDLINQNNIKLEEYGADISKNKKDIEELKKEKSRSTDFTAYYADVLKTFTGPNKEESADLVGEEPDEKAYIDAYIEVGPENMLFLRYLDEWFVQKDHGVILLYGEPGHGKSTLCKKVTVEYIRGNLLKDKAKNVLTVSLNTDYNPTIIQDGAIKISNALVWGPDREGVFSYEDCRGSLLFMDGFDEFIDAARISIKDIDIISFIKRIDKIATKYNIHVVVLSRTTAVQKYLQNEAISNRSFQLLPITENQQDDWMDRHAEYNDYRDTFNLLRENGNMLELLGVPLLFRLIIHNRFDRISSNIVELYDNLFSHLMDKRDIRDERLDSVRYGLMDLAYKIYCNDTIYAAMMKKEPDKAWVLYFYLEIPEIAKNGNQKEYKVGFYHRSFYQYFLAQFIYYSLLNVTNKNAKKFIGYFAERQLDDEVRTYLALMLKETDKQIIYSKMDIVINALVETEGFYNPKPKYAYGTSEKSRIMRATNVYLNVLHIAYALGYVIQIPFKGKLDILCRTYKSCRIRIYSNADKKADLSGANLSGADLREANLSGADLSRADLSGADLSRADLSGANLSGANLSGAILENANLFRANLYRASLFEAQLRRAGLMEVNLSRADLSRANLNGAELNRADLSRAYLGGADLSEASLMLANLSGARIFRDNLKGVNLNGADLTGADLTGAVIDTSINMVNSLFRTIIDLKYKEQIHKDIEGYDSIIWLEHESPKKCLFMNEKQ